jgi:hypothetical protein
MSKPGRLLRQGIQWCRDNLSLVDLIFIGLALTFVFGFYFLFKRQQRSIMVRFKVTDEKVLYATTKPTNEYALGFVVGDVEKDELGRVRAEIVDVESYAYDPETMVVYLDVRLKAIYNPRKNIYSLKGKNLVFGESFTFSFSKVHFDGIVVDFPGFQEGEEIKIGTKTVRGQLRYAERAFSDIYGVPDYVAQAVRAGDTVKDRNGNELAKVLKVETLPAQRTVVTDLGRVIKTTDPVLQDVYYTFELRTKTVDGKTFVFDYVPLAVDQVINLNFDTISIWPTITEIIE